MHHIEVAISKYKSHPGLNAIRGSMSKLDNPNLHSDNKFLHQTLKELEKLDLKKASQANDIPVKVI